MKDLVKKIAIAGVGVSLLSGFAMASIGNEETGYGSLNVAKVDQNNKTEVEVENSVKLHNEVSGLIETGDNKSSKNTGDGEVMTGDADANISVENDANKTEIDVDTNGCGGTCGASYSVKNETTGAESTNIAKIEENNRLEIEVENSACVTNEANIETNTGGNKASYNTGDGSVNTGDASVTIEFSTNLNSSEVEVN